MTPRTTGSAIREQIEKEIQAVLEEVMWKAEDRPTSIEARLDVIEEELSSSRKREPERDLLGRSRGPARYGRRAR